MRVSIAAGLVTLGALLSAQEIQLVPVASGLSGPLGIENAGDGSGRLFFVQQNGVVRIFRNGAVVARPFLDIRSKTAVDSERGLLGLAFPPGFAQKQRFYVDYTDLNGNTVIAQYRVSADPDQADASSETILLRVNQPFANHNGGRIEFGPDGYLYIGVGDGGSGGDPMGNGQKLGVLLGKLLRIDVESDPGQVQIPPDNPFVNRAGARPQIWAYGLRNPWRFSFDRTTGDLWIADVGQNNYEEVDFQPSGDPGGEDYGWNIMEGLHCYPDTANCNRGGLTLPIFEYSHVNGNCSITGGFVYRGRVSPGLRGTYIYADYCSGQIWGIDRQGTQANNRLLRSAGFNITSFGEDEAGEIYVADATHGAIDHIVGGLAPRFSATGVVNAASFLPGLTPGSLGTVFAAGVLDDPGVLSADHLPFPASLGDVSVTVNGVTAPILALANRNGVEQANFQTPFETPSSGTASVVVTRSGNPSTPADVPIIDPQPAIYTSDGTQAIVVHNADYSLVTTAHPLQPGEYAFLYASGLGAVTNTPVTGAAAPVLPLAMAAAHVQVTLGGISCDVPFAGLAPGFAGVYQVDFRVPANAPSGGQDLAASIGVASSPTTTTVVQ